MDIAQIRRANLLKLYAQFVAEQQAASPDAKLVGLDGAFSAKLMVHNTYWSGMKSGSRQIGDKLARQVEVLAGVPKGWLDIEHDPVNSAELQRFLDLARKAYLAADSAGRAKLRQALKG